MIKKVLLYLGKFPGYGNDVDGGSILARQLIDSLKDKCQLDIVFIRKNKETYDDDCVNSIRYVEYKDAFNNKFIRRLENLDTNRNALSHFELYDVIVTAHVSKFFGMKEDETEFWKKTILFPMFCTPSYQKAGEIVPSYYTELERIVLANTHKIITPSQIERDELISSFGCPSNKIVFIPRGINPCFKFNLKELSDDIINIVYIASIKPQKNNLDALRMLSVLRQNSSKFHLHLVCTLQDKELHQRMLEYSQEHNLDTYIHYHIGLQQSALALLLHNMDISISVSNWETFGRGIYEGISSGLPTFAMNRLREVKNFCSDNKGVTFVDDIKEMASKILELTNDKNDYMIKQKSLKIIAERLSYSNESNKLANAILYE